jgi:hypothetical protein
VVSVIAPPVVHIGFGEAHCHQHGDRDPDRGEHVGSL